MSARDRALLEKVLSEIGIIKAEFRPTQQQQPRLDALNAQCEQLKQAIPASGTGLVDRRKWQQLEPLDQQSLRDQAVALREAYRRLAGRAGPTDPHHFMCDTYASNGHIFLLGAYAFVGTIALLIALVAIWQLAVTRSTGTEYEALSESLESLRDAEDAQKQEAEQALSEAAAALVQANGNAGPAERIVLLVVVLFGALGGFLRIVGSWVKYVGNRQLSRSWLPYYYFMPIQGVILAPIIYMLLRVGILAPSVGTDGGTQQLNLLGIYAFAALSGLFAKDALDKLAEVFKTIFRTEKKDTIQPLSVDR